MGPTHGRLQVVFPYDLAYFHRCLGDLGHSGVKVRVPLLQAVSPNLWSLVDGRAQTCKTREINIPKIRNGAIQGYAVTQFLMSSTP